MPRDGLFVVRKEGGEYEWLSAAEWARAVNDGVPIYGAKVGDFMIGRDRIVRRHGLRDLWVISRPFLWDSV
jgi:hypothetical protein